mmetsp:Transcript_22401/g.62114  ORF Transcript_22401/g.62114 Transcript_22401/m.62114 type:complete len:223 (+) Transcript_22401:460-1128(+)
MGSSASGILTGWTSRRRRRMTPPPRSSRSPALGSARRKGRENPLSRQRLLHRMKPGMRTLTRTGTMTGTRTRRSLTGRGERGFRWRSEPLTEPLYLSSPVMAATAVWLSGERSLCRRAALGAEMEGEVATYGPWLTPLSAPCKHSAAVFTSGQEMERRGQATTPPGRAATTSRSVCHQAPSSTSKTLRRVTFPWRNSSMMGRRHCLRREAKAGGETPASSPT